ncbi:hypothetical protein N7537_009212 [Penicillium hordei]|uniref:Quercetin 2,3-dioxygenase n=1 Tax=Penicillium hordei TaxID=40994 RepID=A0AAD6DS97_9EURO|nr:uncharacterized protein N7537_009212 [Penicillium hordei]KAJ5592308.1 hypothetical protein N7537_009212 [Penicillium hordei]
MYFLLVVFITVAAGISHGRPSTAPNKLSTSSVPDLYVENAPDYLRPYVIPHYANSHAVSVGSQVYRFMVTGPSSDYAFTLMGTNAPVSAELGVLPHIHQRYYENFYNLKGRFQLWADKGNSGQQARLLSQGDYGSVPRNTTHTFQVLDPDTEIIGTIVPGGFEDLFYALGTNFTSSTNTPYVPAAINASTSGGSDPSTISALQQFDVYAQLDFAPRRDLINGTAPSGTDWHTGSNSLGAPATPYFIANGYGSKYLNSRYGYQIVQPLVTPTQAQDLNFTQSTITISRLQSNITVPVYRQSGSSAFQVIEGILKIKIGDYPTAILTSGDVAFIPGNVSYSYWSDVFFTKVLYVSRGIDGLDQKLIKGGKHWDFVTFPKD